MTLKFTIKKFVRKIKYGVRCDSDTYVNYLRKLGMKIGERTTIFNPRFTIIDETRPWMIDIGNDVQITSGVTILTHGYDWSVLKGKYGAVLGSCGKVKIGNNVFIGMNTTILKSVEIGENVIIGAGSLINKNIPSNCVVAGNPAKVLMGIDSYYKKRKSAQYEEAQELVQCYRDRYGTEVSDDELAEFFWLYVGKEDNYAELAEVYKAKMRLIGNEKLSLKRLYMNSKQFCNKNEFLKSIKKN